MLNHEPAKCHCGSRSWGKEPETSRYTCVSCYRPLWMPIASAPKDGTEVLGYLWYEKEPEDDYEFYNVVYWEKGIGWCLNGGDCIKFRVTHWMPLPEPPKLD